MKMSSWMSFSKQAWPLLYSRLWRQYLAFTPPSSLCSCICVLAQVATCPQVMFAFTYMFNILDKLSIYDWKKQGWRLCHMDSSYWFMSPLRHLCCGEFDDRLCGGAVGSHSSGDELKLVCSGWVWGPKDRSGLSCGTPFRNHSGKRDEPSVEIQHKHHQWILPILLFIKTIWFNFPAQLVNNLM